MQDNAHPGTWRLVLSGVGVQRLVRASGARPPYDVFRRSRRARLGAVFALRSTPARVHGQPRAGHRRTARRRGDSRRAGRADHRRGTGCRPPSEIGVLRARRPGQRRPCGRQSARHTGRHDAGQERRRRGRIDGGVHGHAGAQSARSVSARGRRWRVRPRQLRGRPLVRPQSDRTHARTGRLRSGRAAGLCPRARLWHAGRSVRPICRRGRHRCRRGANGRLRDADRDLRRTVTARPSESPVR